MAAEKERKEVGLALDTGKREVKGRKGKAHLTPKEGQLLSLFMANPGQVLTRKFLMKEVWNTDYLDDTRTLDVHICRVRKKLRKVSDGPWIINTERGVGYRFDPSEK